MENPTVKSASSLGEIKEGQEIGNKGDLKELLSHFYANDFARGGLEDYLKDADPIRQSRQVLLSPSPDSTLGHVYAESLVGGVVRFSLTTENKEMGRIELGVYKRGDIVDLVKGMSKVSPTKKLRNFDDSPNVCMR